MKIDQFELISHISDAKDKGLSFSIWSALAAVHFSTDIKRIEKEFEKLLELADEMPDILDLILLEVYPMKKKSEVLAGHMDGKNRDHNGKIIPLDKKSKFKATGKPNYQMSGILPHAKDRRK